MKKILLSVPVFITGVFLLCNLSAVAQQASVAVNNFSGTAVINVPVCVLRSGTAVLPVSLAYSGGGVKIKETEGTAGIGWNLMAGGEIRREVRGLPDDQTKDNGNAVSTGWLYNTNGTKINNFTIANDNNNTTCPDGTTDLNYLNTNFSDLSDTEPDIFYLNIPGVSCQLVFDKDHTIRTVPFQDIKVSYVTYTEGSAIGRIKSFTVVTDQGLKYFFTDQEAVNKTTSTSLAAANIKYFKREFDQYKNGITYISAWKLTTVSDINNNTIYLYYTVPTNSRSANSRIRLATGTDTTMVVPFSVNLITTEKILNKIVYDNYDGIINARSSLDFTYLTASTSSAPVLSTIRGQAVSANLGYTSVTTKETNSSRYKTFLTNVSFNGLNGLKFDYNGLTASKINMPDSLSKEIDQWGYYNGSGATSLLPQVYINPNTNGLERYRTQVPGGNSTQYTYAVSGAARDVNPGAIINGSLSTVTYYYGGTTSLVYEPNDYYDVTAGRVIQGGGIRVKQIVDYDGGNVAKNIIRNYSYLNPATSLSSGKPLSLPLLAFSKPYTATGTVEEKWQKSTVRLEESVSPENNSVVYTHVKTSQAGAGSTLYEYLAPATYWDTSALPDWMPTVINIAGPSCIAVGYMANMTNTYPFAQNPNFDFERGLVKKITVNDESNNKIKESTYTYTRSATPLLVPGLKYELIEGVASYTKYNVLTALDNLVTQVQNVEYDAPSATATRLSTTNNYYEGANHKLMTSQMLTNADGSIFRNYIKYVKDYPATSATTDITNTAIYNLQLQNANLPVESYAKAEHNGVNKTISATLIKFRPFTATGLPAMYVPSQKLSFVSNNGVSDFAVSAISSNTFTNDSRYDIIENDVIYDATGRLLTKDNGRKKVSTVLTDYRSSLPVAIINNARADEIAFNDFETEGVYYPGFTTLLNKLDASNSRTGKYSMAITSADSFSCTLAKNNSAENTIFSVWIKSASAGNLTFTLANSTVTVYTYAMPYANTAGAWKYYEIKVPMANVAASFTAKYQSSTAISVDDILFYPDNAVVNTIGYNPDNYLKTAETNTNGVAKYYVYDSNRRLRHTLDQDKNIVLKTAYIKDGDASSFTAGFSAGVATAGAAATFSANSTNSDGAVYTWNFGDGTAIVTGTSPTTTHTFTTAGSYTVSLSKSSPFFPSVSSSISLPVNPPAVQQVTLGAYYPGGTIGTINFVDFYKNNVRVASFTGAQLASGTTYQVPSDYYTIKVSVSGSAYSTANPTGYKRVAYTTSSGVNDCVAAVNAQTTVYQLFVDLRTERGLSVRVDDTVCTPSGGIE